MQERVVHLGARNYSQFPDDGGGTGFHVIAPSGKTFIMTNRHVCQLAVNNLLWAVVEGFTQDHQVKVVYASDAFDLCLVEPIPGVEGVTVGDVPYIGQEIHYFGHPRGQQGTFVSGEAVGYHKVLVALGVIGTGIRDDQCKNKDNVRYEQTELQVFFNQLSSARPMLDEPSLVTLDE